MSLKNIGEGDNMADKKLMNKVESVIDGMSKINWSQSMITALMTKTTDKNG
jgi:hypothetical protein